MCETPISGKSTKFKWCNTMTIKACRKSKSCKIGRNKQGRLMCKCKCQDRDKQIADLRHIIAHEQKLQQEIKKEILVLKQKTVKPTAPA